MQSGCTDTEYSCPVQRDNQCPTQKKATCQLVSQAAKHRQRPHTLLPDPGEESSERGCRGWDDNTATRAQLYVRACVKLICVAAPDTALKQVSLQVEMLQLLAGLLSPCLVDCALAVNVRNMYPERRLLQTSMCKPKDYCNTLLPVCQVSPQQAL